MVFSLKKHDSCIIIDFINVLILEYTKLADEKYLNEEVAIATIKEKGNNI